MGNLNYAFLIGGEGGWSYSPFLPIKTIENVFFLYFFGMVKYSQFSLLTWVSTDLVSPRPYPWKCLVLAVKKKYLKSWIDSTTPHTLRTMEYKHSLSRIELRPAIYFILNLNIWLLEIHFTKNQTVFSSRKLKSLSSKGGGS